MEKPQAILDRGLRKETVTEVCRLCEGNIPRIADYLHIDQVRVRVLLETFGIHPIRKQGGDTVIADDTLLKLAKDRAGYGHIKLPELDKNLFIVAWQPKVWSEIIEAAEQILEENGSIYLPA